VYMNNIKTIHGGSSIGADNLQAQWLPVPCARSHTCRKRNGECCEVAALFVYGKSDIESTREASYYILRGPNSMLITYLIVCGLSHLPKNKSGPCPRMHQASIIANLSSLAPSPSRHTRHSVRRRSSAYHFEYPRLRRGDFVDISAAPHIEGV
jgi:hypothetical protein